MKKRRSVLLFQSTHPVRGATLHMLELCWMVEFQSTHPVRGATKPGELNEAFPAISIHAPREGCDAT